MSKLSALSTLLAIERLIEANRALAERKGILDYWHRDCDFLATARNCIESNAYGRLRWLSDEMRNLSQGFGSYCDDVTRLDSLVEALFIEVQQLAVDSRNAVE